MVWLYGMTVVWYDPVHTSAALYGMTLFTRHVQLSNRRALMGWLRLVGCLKR